MFFCNPNQIGFVAEHPNGTYCRFEKPFPSQNGLLGGTIVNKTKLVVEITKYIPGSFFCVYRRSYLIWFPAIVYRYEIALVFTIVF